MNSYIQSTSKPVDSESDTKSNVYACEKGHEPFDLIAPTYSKFHRARCYDQLALELVDCFKPDTKVLEVGCGDGWFVRCMILAGIKNITALDSSIEMLRKAKTLNPENVRFIHTCHDYTFPELGSEKFDVIVAKFVLHDSPNISAALATLVNLLETNGKLVIVDRYWQDSLFGNFRLFFGMEYWLLSTFISRHGIFLGLKKFAEDLIEWFSKPWRLHRATELPTTLDTWNMLLKEISNSACCHKINPSSFSSVIMQSELNEN